MFGLTTIELRMASYALLLVGIAGFLLYERHEGAETVIVKDNTAELKQSQRDTQDARNTIVDLQKQLASIPATVPDAAPMRVCVAPAGVSQRPTSSRVQPAASSASVSDQRVQTGTQPGVDIGPAVQDLTLDCVLATTYATDLYQLAVKESAK